MSKDHYLTIRASSEGMYKEKGSKFLAFAYPVDEVTQIDLCIDNLKKKYHDARHHCYAYRLGKGGKLFRSNDDGEPNHSAGDPILGQIKSFELTNTLENAEIIRQTWRRQLKVDFEYEAMNDMMRIVKSYNLEIKNQQFDLQCQLVLNIPESKWGEVCEQFAEYGQIKPIN